MKLSKELLSQLQDELRKHGISTAQFNASIVRFEEESALIDWAATTLTATEAHAIRDQASKIADDRAVFWRRNGGMQLTMSQLAKCGAEADFPSDHATHAIFYTIAMIELLVEEQINRMGQQS